MSFSEPTLKNPCKKFIEFKGDKGIFQYYDKEKEENVQLQTPCYLVVLDQLSTIKGFSDEYQSGIYSNEVHSLVNEILRVKSFKGYLTITGLYKDIKAEIISAGGKFAKSVYCMKFDDKGNKELVNFQLSGAAFSSWLEFKFDQQRHVVCITGDNLKEKKGAINYMKPVFSRFSIKENIIQDAIEMDHELQSYLKQYKEGQKEEEIHKEEKTASEVFHETNYDHDKKDVYPEYRQKDIPPEPEEGLDLPF